MIATVAAFVFVSAVDGHTLTIRSQVTDEDLKSGSQKLTRRSAQPYSQVSRRNLISLPRGRLVELEKVDVDRYGRTVAHSVEPNLVGWRPVCRQQHDLARFR